MGEGPETHGTERSISGKQRQKCFEVTAFLEGGVVVLRLAQGELQSQNGIVVTLYHSTVLEVAI
jgi:hypothetical protein